MDSLVDALCDAINANGTSITISELKMLAFSQFSSYEIIEDADGFQVEANLVVTRKDWQKIADIYAPGFDCINF